MKILFVCSLVAFVVLPCIAQVDEDQGHGQLEHQRRKFLFGTYTKRTRLTTLTSTMLYSCVSSLQVTTACQGRKRKRDVDLTEMNVGNVELSADIEKLSSSLNIEEPFTQDRKGKLFVNITTFTTFTTTEFATNTLTTVSISYACRPIGDDLPPPC